MALTVALQMDPLDSIEPMRDTTLLLGWEAERRGHAVWYYTPTDLSASEGRILADAHKVSIHLDEEKYYTLGERKMLDLAEVDVVLLRQNPPFDMAYLTTTYLLDMLPPNVKVINPAHAVRDLPEKLFPLYFPAYIPETLVTRSLQQIREFHARHREIVLKPLYSFSGRSVFHINESGANLAAITELMLSQSAEPIIAQRFLANVITEERRILMIDGVAKAVIARFPGIGEVRTNVHAGGRAERAELTPGQRTVCEHIGKVLKEKNIVLVGLDMIGDTITEINITSPSLLREANRYYGLTLERDFWDAVERNIAR